MTQHDDIQTLFKLIRELNHTIGALQLEVARLPGQMAEAVFACERRHRKEAETRVRWNKNTIATWAAISIAFGSLLHSFGVF